MQLELQQVMLRELWSLHNHQDAQLRQLRYLKMLAEQRELQQTQREEEEQQAQQDQREWHILERQLHEEEERERQQQQLQQLQREEEEQRGQQDQREWHILERELQQEEERERQEQLEFHILEQRLQQEEEREQQAQAQQNAPGATTPSPRRMLPRPCASRFSTPRLSRTTTNQKGTRVGTAPAKTFTTLCRRTRTHTSTMLGRSH